MATKKRRLEDLYVRGRELSIDDGSGDPVTVWLQKLNPLEHEKAIRRSGAARAQVLLAARDQDSEEWGEAYADVRDLGDRTILVEYLIADDVVKTRDSKEAELSFGEEWTKDNFLQGLRDAWEGDGNGSGLKERFAVDPNDEEAHKVFVELKRFSDLVDAEAEPEIERLRRDYADISEQELQDKALGRFIELRAGLAWLREFRHSEAYFATRDIDDHRRYYFTERQQVDVLSPEVFNEISVAYQQLMVESAEGKDSPRTPSSSPSSEPQNAAVI